jgi:hypothetical protein
MSKSTETRPNSGQAQNAPIPNPRGNQTLPQPKPALPRSPDGRFAREFNPHPGQTKPNLAVETGYESGQPRQVRISGRA